MIGGIPVQQPLTWVRGTKVEALFSAASGTVVWVKFKGVDGWKAAWMGGMLGGAAPPGAVPMTWLLLTAKSGDRVVDVALNSFGGIQEVFVW